MCQLHATSCVFPVVPQIVPDSTYGGFSGIMDAFSTAWHTLGTAKPLDDALAIMNREELEFRTGEAAGVR
jgi:hypothetical protein